MERYLSLIVVQAVRIEDLFCDLVVRDEWWMVGEYALHHCVTGHGDGHLLFFMGIGSNDF